ncbi:hypothetical protein WP50_13425, partial [Lactiplantibacillus plantarum]
MATSATLSVMPMPAKETFTVRELFAATLVGSSNSGAIALGEYVAGSNDKFIKLMNQQASKWHLDASFISASGLDNTDLKNYDLKIKGTWTDAVPIRKNVRKMATSATLSVMPMPAKETFTVRELFAATLVGSSNSGAIALGEYVAGSNDKFIKLMNQQASKWHLDASFISASGLDNTDLKNYDLKIKGTSDQDQNLVKSGQVVYAQNADQKLPIASL